ncbi:hypothetical protein GCM10007108_05960 [Thermogymnomonas acidicola]|uniref:Uncharacterized protein n=1 Tax=Thermogymnomonas acidicola TaxID=399579 RepID=A0AA37F923_9ARCH|nr:transcriptional regulator [Thermogymnomonas acidicola]GGM70726.1 hypothetical protein GCM10007108_05960 [Thermogymnomonas acidicola]
MVIDDNSQEDVDLENSIFKEIQNDIETVKRHITIITTLLREQPAGIIRISQVTKMPEHKIRYSLRILEREGLIEPSREGAILTPKFVDNKQKIAEQAKKLAKEMEEIYENLRVSLGEASSQKK